MFRDRIDGANRLLSELHEFRGDNNAVVLGLPRGGVPVAAVVAEELELPLDVVVVRKLGAPFQPELAMGAIAEGGTRVLHETLISELGVDYSQLARVEQRELAMLNDRVQLLRRNAPPRSLDGCTAILVDDGLATGATAEAACRSARARGADRVVFAAPVGPHDAARRVPSADRVICANVPDSFYAVGQAYAEFAPTSDEEVILLVDEARQRVEGRPWRARIGIRTSEVEVPTGRAALRGTLGLPADPTGFVIFAHGSGSSRSSPRNRLVAGALNRAGIGTLLMDLLLPREEAHREKVFDIPMLGERLVLALHWLRTAEGIRRLPIGYFGASTGAGAALWAAAAPESAVTAIVSRGGRPDLAGDRLGSVSAPVMLIVGGDDAIVLDLNRNAQARLNGPSELVVVPGATHLFEEPGALAEVAIAARRWFLHWFSQSD
ncbi:phosphoribosyltransferase family protein [Ruicaihuangia caeni]|uniref:Phosphoribosyltransferase family protein n=1 Tax=Ruicaihuangia caeni TaxID=3042517 RepID=A0AAW6T8W9_9MICO|nr:phosphoribosyltransferase family protein [Klugiella sp. YN-L-19]MDI2097592.1 phosphoribosyltransferase family protein [Klugiella sp. YN-L-19]